MDLRREPFKLQKKLIKKARDDNRDPEIALLELRNTPVSGVGLSPVEILMGRKTKSTIPIKRSLLKPRDKSHKMIPKNLEKTNKNRRRITTLVSKKCLEFNPTSMEGCIQGGRGHQPSV